MVQKLMLYGMPVSLFVSGFFFPIGVLVYWFTNNLWTLAQQFYILKKLPIPGSPEAKAKAAADGPVVDPRTLAPRPGAKPVRGKPGLPPSSPTNGVTPTDGPTPTDGGTPADDDAKAKDDAGKGPVADGGPSSDTSPNGKPPGGSPPGENRRGQGQQRGKRKRR
jgi:YidC/Oxa1 family membrane protein insertase